MGRVRASIDVPALASEAEQLWYDTSRWFTFIDGFHHVTRLEGEWPHAGARLLWDSNPGGRGRVQERVLEYVAREGQTNAIEDEKIQGTQRVSFTPTAQGATVSLDLRYTLKDSKFMVLVDLLFIRRQQRDALLRTLRRFATEVTSEREGSV